MAGTEHRLFDGVRVPGIQQAAKLALLPPPVQAGTIAAAARGGGRDWSAPWSEPRVLRLPTAAGASHASGSGVQSQEGVAGAAPTRLAGHGTTVEGTGWTTAQGAGPSGRTQSALGLGHHGHPVTCPRFLFNGVFDAWHLALLEAQG